MVIIIIMVWTNDDLYKLKNRDRGTFERMYNAYKDKIYTFLIIKTNGNKELTEDLASETFHSAILSASKLRNTKNIFAWLIQIANRRFYDSLRSKYREDNYLSNYHENNTYSKDIAASIDNKEKILLINTSMDNLKQEYSSILKMKYIEDKSQKEIAKTIKKSIKATESMLIRAKKALKKEIEKLDKGTSKNSFFSS